MKHQAKEKKLRWPLVTIGVVLIACLGTTVSREIGLRRVTAIARENGIEVRTKWGLDNYKGDPEANADTWLGRIRFYSHGDALDKGSVLTDERILHMAEKAGQCSVFVPAENGEGWNRSYSNLGFSHSAVQVLALEATKRADAGDLEGCLAELKPAVNLTNLTARLSNTRAAAHNADQVKEIVRALVKVTPKFRGFVAASQALEKVIASIEDLNFAAIFESETSDEVDVCSTPIASCEIFEGPLEVRAYGVLFEFSRPIWAPKIVQAMADDLKIARVTPGITIAPTPHLDSLRKEGGIENAPLELLTPSFEYFRQHMLARRAKLELARLAVQAILSGTMPSVAGTRDPLGSGPYNLESLPDGWRLSSVGPGGYSSSLDKESDFVITYSKG